MTMDLIGNPQDRFSCELGSHESLYVHVSCIVSVIVELVTREHVLESSAQVRHKLDKVHI